MSADGAARAERLRQHFGRSWQERAERVGMWVRAALLDDYTAKVWCAAQGLRVTKASGETIDSAGGFLVPDEIEASVVSLRDVAGVLRRSARVLTMGSDRRSWPRRTGGPTIGFLEEGAAVPGSDASWDSVGLTAKKVGAITRLSSELFEDSAVDFGAWFVEELGLSVAQLEDACGLIGDGSADYGGMIGAATFLATAGLKGRVATTSGNTDFTKVTAVDLSNLMGALPSYAWANAKWFLSGYGVGACLGRLGMTGGLPLGRLAIMAAAPTTPFGAPVGGAPLAYCGFPVEICPAMPGTGTLTGKVMVMFGDARQAIALGSRRGLTVRVSAHRYLEIDQVALLGTSRFDVNAHSLGDASAAGPLVGLVATA